MPEISHEDVARLIEKLHQERAMDFRGYKPSSLGRRTARRLEQTNCASIDEYMSLLDRRPEEYIKLIDSILINVTQFLRDPDAWDVLRTDVLPQMLAEKHAGDSVRIWSAGCATGEEAYSLAISLLETAGSRISDYDVKIVATDIDEDAVNIARRATYEDDAVACVPKELLNRYFAKNSHWTVSRDVRKYVTFGIHNLTKDPPISHVDIIACRNVLIYMNVNLQNQLLGKFHYGLEPGGVLFLGKAESLLTASKMFSPVNEKWRIFRKEATSGAGRLGTTQQAIGQSTQVSAEEYDLSFAFNESVLRYIPTGVIAVDQSNIIRLVNSAAEATWGVRAADLLGKSLLEAEGWSVLQEVLTKVPQVRSQRSEVRIDELDVGGQRGGRQVFVSVSMNPMFDIRGNMLGVVVVSENITNQIQARRDREAAIEQLQATNEELETTNEELQSTNEELETTNEELQSTNEELETTNEELQSTNEELSTTNDELAARTAELNTVSLYYQSVMENLRSPLVVLSENEVVLNWNAAAEHFYGIAADEATGSNFLDMALPVRVPRTKERLAKVRETLRRYTSRPIKYKTRTGSIGEIIAQFEPLLDSARKYRGAIVTIAAAGTEPPEPAGR